MGFDGVADATTCAGELTFAAVEGEETVKGKDAQLAVGGVGAGGAGSGLLAGVHETVVAAQAGNGCEDPGVGAGAGPGVPGVGVCDVELGEPPQPAINASASAQVNNRKSRFSFTGVLRHKNDEQPGDAVATARAKS